MRRVFITLVAVLGVALGASRPARAAAQCSVGVVVNDLRFLGTPGLGTLEATISYPSPQVDFVGSGSDVACVQLPDGAGDQAVVSDDDAGTLTVSFVSASGVPGLPSPLLRCTTMSEEEPSPSDFVVTVTKALDPGGSPLGFTPNVFVSDDIVCSGPTTTTTVTTTTTLPAPACADPLEPFGEVTASDCLFIFRVALELSECAPACVCAPGGAVPPLTTDVLLCLREATRQEVSLDCPCS